MNEWGQARAYASDRGDATGRRINKETKIHIHFVWPWTWTPSHMPYVKPRPPLFLPLWSKALLRLRTTLSVILLCCGCLLGVRIQKGWTKISAGDLAWKERGEYVLNEDTSKSTTNNNNTNKSKKNWYCRPSRHAHAPLPQRRKEDTTRLMPFLPLLFPCIFVHPCAETRAREKKQRTNKGRVDMVPLLPSHSGDQPCAASFGRMSERKKERTKRKNQKNRPKG